MSEWQSVSERIIIVTGAALRNAFSLRKAVNIKVFFFDILKFSCGEIRCCDIVGNDTAGRCNDYCSHIQKIFTFRKLCLTQGNRNTVVDVATGFGGFEESFSAPSGATDFLSQKRPNQLWGPPNILFQGQKVKVKLKFSI
jgi:hypothetical protein